MFAFTWGCSPFDAIRRNWATTQFLADEKTYDATLRHLIIIGEAVKQIPEEVRGQYPAVEWKQIARFRDHVIHRYFSANDDIIWDVVVNKVPQLLTALAADEQADQTP